MANDSGVSLSELRVDGGMTANSDLLQFLANTLGTNVVRPKISETTAAGVAYAAGLSVGVWSSLEEITALWTADQTFTPNMKESE
eukprot:scaffold138249_cov24-Attheya_sp.AAC.1